MPELKALSVDQPWDAAILAGVQTVDNRSWYLRGPYPRWVALYTTHIWSPDAAAFAAERWPLTPTGPREAGFYGAVRFDSMVRRWHRQGDPWATGPHCWVIGAALVLPEPILIPGKGGLWDLDDDTAALILPHIQRFEADQGTP